MPNTHVLKWHKRIWDGRDEVEDEDRWPKMTNASSGKNKKNDRSGRHETSITEVNNITFIEIVRKDQRMSVRLLADMTSIEIVTVSTMCTWRKFEQKWYKWITVLDHPQY